MEEKNEDSTGKKKMDSIVANLFFGKVDEDQVFPYPKVEGENLEMAKEMTEAVRRFCEENISPHELDEMEKIPDEIIKGLSELGLMGLGVSEELGGMGLNYTLYARVFAEVAGHDGSTATMLGAHQGIGYRGLMLEGTKEQKEEWLPKLASGEMLASFCLTEPGSGSDAYSIKTRAVENPDGTFSITGQKLWITNAGSAGFYSVFCKTQHDVEGETKEKISCFIVEKEREGISFGEKEKKMGIRASETRAVYFDNVIVPASNRIGEPGKGFKLAMNILNSGRLSLGAGCVGGMKTIIRLASKHAGERKQFGKPIGEFGLIQEKLAQMAANCYAAESLVFFTTGKIDQGMNDYYLESAICKVYCSEALWKTVDMGLQIAGGTGYMREYPYELILRDSRIHLIFEGTNEILRVFLALSGVRGPSEGLKEIGKIADVSAALNDPVKSLGLLTDFATDRFSKMLGHASFTKCHESLKSYAEKLTSMVSNFAIQVDNSLIKYGKKIIDVEMVQGRIANMAINLYVSLAVMSRTTSILNDSETSDEDKEYVLGLAKIALKDCRKNYVKELKGMSKNQDKAFRKVSEKIIEKGGFGLDII